MLVISVRTSWKHACKYDVFNICGKLTDQNRIVSQVDENSVDWIVVECGQS
jgi:hypothetical protein